MPVLLSILGILIGAFLVVWLIGERGALLRGSTWALLREGGWRKFFNGDFFHAYVYGRWSRLYIGRGINHTFPRLQPVEGERRWADQYHGKVLPLELAERLITINEDLHCKDLEQIIPYKTAREIVLKSPVEVAAYECPCRHSRENPCQPTLVCMIVGQPFVDFILEHHPTTSKRITQEEALQLLRDEHERGHLHAAYFKDVMLERFYAICNCCKCCCGGIEAMRDRGVPMVTSSGYVAEVDADECAACGTCETICPFNAITVNGVSSVDWEKCLGCGVCEGQCAYDAIRLVRDERKGIPLDVRALAS
jgi:Pyruvate/2-oxoacid:ferredoxin oxidoreductase delta subunit